ncbi:superoxide dismutase family protein [Sphingomicrobium marinum]|uniref:superoxide dismutase family protein n=1 Tax=Sphingomicrobium marinum TaxID=1227950 RepID=UPI00223EBDDE|nr:superoxide dismutase family protein [Sphingomicrobium marinum]
MKPRFSMLAASLLLAACYNADDNDQNISIDENGSPAAEGEVTLMSPTGEQVGTVAYLEEPSGMQLRISVNGLAPGVHAVHLHTTGTCEAPDFSTAGGHWNPMGKEHGRDNPDGAHLGDLANMNVGEDGTGTATYMVAGVSFEGVEPAMSDSDGTALVIHEGADDYATDPTGDAGGRVACAVLAEAA